MFPFHYHSAGQQLCRLVKRENPWLFASHQVKTEIVSSLDDETLSSAKLEEVDMELSRSTTALEDTNMTKKDVNEILFDSGSTQSPSNQQVVKDFFDGREQTEDTHPSDATFYAAAGQVIITIRSPSSNNDNATKRVCTAKIDVQPSGVITIAGW